ncbi:MAG: phosphoribosylglycinamide formyltransferase, partial [Muribaculaceae bacterium]|nr:phosphoribosylglycinamide formyltransferase [Muribaculaceae bacterium]
PGADAIGQAMRYGVKIYGVTVHYVDSTLDGGSIISQAAVEYDGNDREILESMIHEKEHALYPATVAGLVDSLS